MKLQKIKIMKGNISVLDGVIRLFAGIVLGSIAGVLSYVIGAWAIAFVPFIVYLLATAMAGDCPIYRMKGISTGEKPSQGKIEEEERAQRMAA